MKKSGRELTGTDTTQPPRQATPATPPKEGNVPTLHLVQTLSNHPMKRHTFCIYAMVLHNVTPFVFAIRIISNSHK